jgi:hypothetical protein
MLGRKNYTQDEFDQAKAAVRAQVTAYKKLVKAAAGVKSKKKLLGSIDTFEALFFNNMVLALDRYFVYRVRLVAGKDANALNEVELLCESLMNNRGILRVGNVIKFIPEKTVLKLRPGDAIALSLEDFERLSTAFFEQVQKRFLDAPEASDDH